MTPLASEHRTQPEVAKMSELQLCASHLGMLLCSPRVGPVVIVIPSEEHNLYTNGPYHCPWHRR